MAARKFVLYYYSSRLILLTYWIMVLNGGVSKVITQVIAPALVCGVAVYIPLALCCEKMVC